VHLDIIGDSDMILDETENISIYSRGDIAEYERKADLLVCMLNNNGTQIPGKVYHYAATNKPILIIKDGDKQEEIERYLKKFNRYYFCENDVFSIREKVHEIMDKKTWDSPCEEFNPQNIAQKFIDVLELNNKARNF